MPANRNNISWHLRNMIGAPAGVATPKTVFKTEDGITQSYGTTVPSDATTGYAEGCRFTKVDGSAGTNLYVNEGTNESSKFVAVPSFKKATAAGDSGPSPLLWDDALLLEVILNPNKGYYYFNDMMEVDVSGTFGAGTFTVAQRTSGTVAVSLIQGGGVIMDPAAATAAQGITAQLIFLGILPEDGTTIRMEWRMSNDEGAGRIAMGLGVVGTTDWVSDDTMETTADHAMFFKDGGSSDTNMGVSNSDGSNTNATDNVFTGRGTGYETYGIKIVGNGANASDSITFYHNGVAGTHVVTQAAIPDTIMVPTFETNADGSDQPVLVLDWLRILVPHGTDGSRA